MKYSNIKTPILNQSIKNTRIKLCYSEKEFAELLNISLSELILIEKGRFQVTNEIISKVNQILGKYPSLKCNNTFNDNPITPGFFASKENSSLYTIAQKTFESKKKLYAHKKQRKKPAKGKFARRNYKKNRNPNQLVLMFSQMNKQQIDNENIKATEERPVFEAKLNDHPSKSDTNEKLLLDRLDTEMNGFNRIYNQSINYYQSKSLDSKTETAFLFEMKKIKDEFIAKLNETHLASKNDKVHFMEILYSIKEISKIHFDRLIDKVNEYSSFDNQKFFVSKMSSSQV